MAAAAASRTSASTATGAQCFTAKAPWNHVAMRRRKATRAAGAHVSGMASAREGGVGPGARLLGVRSIPVAIALSIAVLLPAGAPAQPSQLPSDPEANSPSGVVYELPVDRGRKDAAPREPARRGSPGGEAGTRPDGREPTSIRSENNFGSSSVVPGVDDTDSSGADAAGEDSKDKENGAGGGGAGPGSGSGSSGGPGGGDGGTSPLFNTASSAGESSDTLLVWSLLGLIALVGTGLGVFAGRAWRGRGTSA